MAKLTLDEFIATLPPEEQGPFLEQFNANVAFQKRKNRIGSIAAHTQNFGVSALQGLGNSLVALGQLPLQAVGADIDTRPVFGPGSQVGQSSFDVGTAAQLGNFGGFLASFAGPGGLIKGAGTGAKVARGLLAPELLLGGRPAIAAGAGLGPTAAVGARGLHRIPGVSSLAASGGLGERAVRGAGGALEFGALGFTRTPGTLEDRYHAGLHGMPAGALLGVAGRTRGIVTEAGERLWGTKAAQFLNKHGGQEAAVAAGKATMESGLRFGLAQGGRLGTAGAFLPGFSPAEFTGNPRIDSILFNAGFGFAHGAASRFPLFPGREQAQANETRTRSHGADGAPTRIEPTQPGEAPKVAPVETRIPVQDTLFPAQRAPGAEAPLNANEPPPPTRQGNVVRDPSRPLDNPALVENTLFGEVVAYPIGSRVQASGGRGVVTALEPNGFRVRHENGSELIYEQHELRTETTRPVDLTELPESRVEPPVGRFAERLTRERNNIARVTDVEGNLRDDPTINIDQIRAAEEGMTQGWAPDILGQMAGDATGHALVTGPNRAPNRLINRAGASAQGDQQALEMLGRVVDKDLAGMNRSMFETEIPMEVQVVRHGDASNSAAFDSARNIMYVSPRYFQLPRFARQLVLAHELAHPNLIHGAFARMDPRLITTLFQRAGWPARDVSALNARVADLMTQRDNGKITREQLFEGIEAARLERMDGRLQMAQETMDAHFGDRAPELDGYFIYANGRWMEQSQRGPNELIEPSRRSTRIDNPYEDAYLDVKKRGYQVIVAQHTNAEGVQKYTPMTLVSGHLLRRSGKNEGPQPVDNVEFVNIHKSFLQRLDFSNVEVQSQQLNGSRYGYTNPGEYVSEAIAHRFLNGIDSMHESHPGVNTLLDGVFTNKMSATIQGRRNLTQAMDKGDLRQAEMFSRSEFEGPPEPVRYDFADGSTGRFEELARKLDQSRHEKETPPQRKFLAGSEDSFMFLADTPRRNKAWEYLTKPFPGLALPKGVRRVGTSDDILDSAVNAAVDRFSERTDLPADMKLKDLEKEFVRTLRDEASRVMAGTKYEVPITNADGEIIELTDIPGPGATVLTSTKQLETLAAARAAFRTGKGRLVDGQVIFEHSRMAQEVLTEKLHRVFHNGAEGLEAAIPDPALREIIRLRYGHILERDTPIFPDRDGTPMSHEGPLSRAEIGARVKVRTHEINRKINDFIWHHTVDIPLTRDSLLPNLRMPRKPLEFTRTGKIMTPDDVVRDPALPRTRNTKPTFQFRDPADPTQRLRPPRERTTSLEGKDVKVEEFVATKDLPGGVKGVDKRVIPADVSYIDPVTGDVLTRQTSLFDTKEMVRNRAAAERESGPEPAEGQAVEAPPPTRTETDAATTATEALTTSPETPSTPAKPPKQLRLKGAGFGQSRGPADTRFKTGTGVERFAERVFEARNQIGERRMPTHMFEVLSPSEQIQHVIIRLAKSPSAKAYTRALRRYTKLLNKNKKFNTFAQLGQTFSKSRRMDVVLERAEALHVRIEPTREGHLTVAELDSGRVVEVKEVGTAALLLDMRAERLKTAPRIGPREFDHVRIILPDTDGVAGGPRDPIGPDRAADGEANGLPPEPRDPANPLNPHKNKFVFQSSLRTMRDLFATISRRVGDPNIFKAINTLLDTSQRAEFKASEMRARMTRVLKGHKIREARMEAIGEAAIDLDRQGDAQQKVLQDAGFTASAVQRTREFVRAIEDSVYESHGLEPNEIAFLKDPKTRALWDRLWREFGLNDAGYVVGYFSRFRPRDANAGQSSLRDTGPPAEVANFFGMHERTGELQGQSVHYMQVFSAYARAGYRYKLLNGKPGSTVPSPLEFASSVLAQHSETRGNQTVIPEWGAPYRVVMDRALGIPDEGIIRARKAARGRIEGRRDFVKRGVEWAEAENTPIRRAVLPHLRKHFKALDVKVHESNLVLWADYVIGLNRSRAFGLNVMRSIRHITQSSFFVLPRVGPVYFGKGLNDVLDPVKRERIFLQASAIGVIKPAYAHEYINSRSGLLTKLDKLSAIYRYGDIFERMVSYRAQQLKSQDAMAQFKTDATRMSFEEAYDTYAQRSGLNLLHPAYRVVVKDLLNRPTPNYAEAVRQHAKLLTDHALFDYTRTNQPIWSGKIWGRLFGQYGRWPLGAIETMHSMTKYGSLAQRAQIAATYGLVSASVYGMGQALGVKTSEWIPFVHTLSYSGGPALSIVEDMKEVLGGDPIAQEAFASNFLADPLLTLASSPLRLFTPAGDIFEALMADTNLTRRERRLLGVPRRAINQQEQWARLMGFRPVTDAPKHHSLLKEVVGAPFKPIAKEIQILAGSRSREE